MNITIGRYEVPTDEQRAELLAINPAVHFPSDRWESWIEPEDRSWIIYIGANGEPLFWPRREPEGGVIGPPVSRAFIDALYERFGEEAIQEVIEAVRFGQ